METKTDPSQGVIPLAGHPDTSGNPSTGQVIQRAASNQEAALAVLGQAQAALQAQSSTLPNAPGDKYIAAARSTIAFCLSRLAAEAQALKEG